MWQCGHAVRSLTVCCCLAGDPNVGYNPGQGAQCEGEDWTSEIKGFKVATTHMYWRYAAHSLAEHSSSQHTQHNSQDLTAVLLNCAALDCALWQQHRKASGAPTAARG